MAAPETSTADGETGQPGVLRTRRLIPPGTGSPSRGKSAPLPWPLLAVLAVQAGLSLRLVWTNTAFQDEALYLWAGHLEIAHWLHGTPIPEFPPFFSGAPIIYPPIGAIADSLGGLAAARILSLCFMLAATTLLHLTARRLLRDRLAGVYAAAAFALLGPAQALAFATYDAMAIMLLAAAAWLATRAGSQRAEPFLLLAGLAMALANATKYASALWDPAVIAVAVAASWDRGRWHRLARGARTGIYAGAALAVALFGFAGREYLRGILFTTLDRAPSGVPAAAVLGDAFDYAGPVICLVLLAAIASFAAAARIRFLCLSALAACLLAPANQARIHTLTSLHKHVVFGAWFAAIGAGYVIALASRLDRERSWRIAVTVAAVVPLSLISINVAGDLYRSWPPASQMLARLRPLVQPGPSHYLLEQARVADYYLHSDLRPGQVIPVWGCSWWDEPGQREVTGPAACAAEIRARYFRVVETDGSTGPFITRTDDAAIWNAISHSGAYRLVYRGREQYSPHGFFQIWRLSPQRVRLAYLPAAGEPPVQRSLAPYRVLTAETWLTAGFATLVAAVALVIRICWRRGKCLGDL